MGKGKGREVERWDPPNSVMPKLPFPAWGATSKFIRHSEGCCVVKAVERKNDYAENAPKVDVPKEQEGLSYPVSKIEKSSHNYGCDQIADIKLPPLLIGPKLIEDGGTKFVPTIPISDNPLQIHAPILIEKIKGVTASNHHNPAAPAKIDPEPLMSYPTLPVEHGSKYSTQNFGCSGSGLKVQKESTLFGPGNRDTGDRNAAVIEGKNKFLPDQSGTASNAPKPNSTSKPMHGPKLPDIEVSHAYGPVPARIAPAEARMEMPGPVYEATANNLYENIPERVHGELIFAGPKFPNKSNQIVESNVYAPVEERQRGHLINVGPVIGSPYEPIQHDNKFIPESKRVDPQLAMCGPKFRGVSDGSLYNITQERAPCEGERLMTAPAFPGIEAQHKYGPVEPPLAPVEKIKTDKPYSTPKAPGIEASNKYNLEPLENGFPEHAKPVGPPLTAPKYPGIEESHKYGPITERKVAPKDICVPVYTEHGDNKYCHIPERQPGELIQQAPVFRGVESKNVYAPVEEKVKGHLLNVGPVIGSPYEPIQHDNKYIPEIRRAESQLVLAGPKFRGVSDSSLYNITPERAPIDGERLMTAPCFPGIEAQNNFGPAVYSCEPLVPPKKD